MIRKLCAVALVAVVSGCGDGQPFSDLQTTDTSTDPGTNTGTDTGTDTNAPDVLITGTERPPQTPSAIARGDIVRAEAVDGNGGGLVSAVSYIADSDTFQVDGLAFDGLNVYSRGVAVSQLNGYSVFEAEVVTPDFLTGDAIGQFVPTRAVYGVSDNSLANGEPRTSFAIVRTGAYNGYGFGGFIYERNGDVVLPTSGQAIYSGDYAGMRVFGGAGGLEYTTGDMFIQFDFDDFNATDGIYGEISNRRAFDVDGAEIGLGGDGLVLPTLTLVVNVGDTDVQANGEFSGSALNYVDGEVYESGSYYAVIAGDMTAIGDGGEIVGVIVIESTDPRYENITAQETGGFILYRGTGN